MSNKYYWKSRIQRDTLPALRELAGALNFYVDAPGGFHGDPSPPALLDALAGRWRDDPETVAAALRALGIEKGRST